MTKDPIKKLRIWKHKKNNSPYIQQHYKFLGYSQKYTYEVLEAPVASGSTAGTCMTPHPRHRMSDASFMTTWQR